MKEEPRLKLNWDGTGYSEESVIAILAHIQDILYDDREPNWVKRRWNARQYTLRILKK